MHLPNPKCTASVEADSPAHSAMRPLDMLSSTYYAPSKPFTPDDWWQVELDHSLTGKVAVVSGDSRGNRKLTSGVVESSPDGKRWKPAGVFAKQTGVCEFTSPKDARFFRVRSKALAPTDFAIRNFNFHPRR